MNRTQIDAIVTDMQHISKAELKTMRTCLWIVANSKKSVSYVDGHFYDLTHAFIKILEDKYQGGWVRAAMINALEKTEII